MILQALTEYYRVLADRGVLDTPGSVSYTHLTLPTT